MVVSPVVASSVVAATLMCFVTWLSMRGRPCLIAECDGRDLTVMSRWQDPEYRSLGPKDQQNQRTGGV
jgi:hypothetical protein